MRARCSRAESVNENVTIDVCFRIRLGAVRNADHYRQIERIAAVTESGSLKSLSRLASHLVAPDIKVFGVEAEDRALVWLRTGE